MYLRDFVVNNVRKRKRTPRLAHRPDRPAVTPAEASIPNASGAYPREDTCDPVSVSQPDGTLEGVRDPVSIYQSDGIERSHPSSGIPGPVETRAVETWESLQDEFGDFAYKSVKTGRTTYKRPMPLPLVRYDRGDATLVITPSRAKQQRGTPLDNAGRHRRPVGNTRASSTIREFIQYFPNFPERKGRMGLYIHGPVGTGKTCAVEAALRSFEYQWFTTTDMMVEIQMGISFDECIRRKTRCIQRNRIAIIVRAEMLGRDIGDKLVKYIAKKNELNETMRILFICISNTKFCSLRRLLRFFHSVAYYRVYDNDLFKYARELNVPRMYVKPMVNCAKGDLRQFRLKIRAGRQLGWDFYGDVDKKHSVFERTKSLMRDKLSYARLDELGKRVGEGAALSPLLLLHENVDRYGDDADASPLLAMDTIMGYISDFDASSNPYPSAASRAVLSMGINRLQSHLCFFVSPLRIPSPLAQAYHLSNMRRVRSDVKSIARRVCVRDAHHTHFEDAIASRDRIRMTFDAMDKNELREYNEIRKAHDLTATDCDIVRQLRTELGERI